MAPLERNCCYGPFESQTLVASKQLMQKLYLKLELHELDTVGILAVVHHVFQVPSIEIERLIWFTLMAACRQWLAWHKRNVLLHAGWSWKTQGSVPVELSCVWGCLPLRIAHCSVPSIPSRVSKFSITKGVALPLTKHDKS